MWADFSYKNLLDGGLPCFLAGTLVLTANGLIPIEAVKKGDTVVSFNQNTFLNEDKEVLNVFQNDCVKYLKLYTSPTDFIEVTGQHKFYLPLTKIWIAASELKVDDILLNASGQQVTISKLEIIESDNKTYNFEVADNHNYFVGNKSILAHNKAKRLKFTSSTELEYQFYEFIDLLTEKPLYVGQTTQKTIEIRALQHRREFAKNPDKKLWMGNEAEIKRIILKKDGIRVVPPYKMTPFEAAVVETHELSKRGGKRANGKGLFNKKNPVAKDTFDTIKRKHPNFNPCRFYA